MKDSSLISLDKFILILLEEDEETTVSQINDKFIIFFHLSGISSGMLKTSPF